MYKYRSIVSRSAAYYYILCIGTYHDFIQDHDATHLPWWHPSPFHRMRFHPQNIQLELSMALIQRETALTGYYYHTLVIIPAFVLIPLTN